MDQEWEKKEKERKKWQIQGRIEFAGTHFDQDNEKGLKGWTKGEKRKILTFLSCPYGSSRRSKFLKLTLTLCELQSSCSWNLHSEH